MSMILAAHRLFAFGTLLDAVVQEHLFGESVPTSSASLDGFRLVDVTITDPEVIAASGLSVHKGLKRSVGGSVAGGVLALSDAQLAAADAYEVEDYARRRVLLADGTSCWAYLAADPLASAERIGIIGDSIAYGRSDPAGGWAASLSQSHNNADEVLHRLFNLALPGERLSELRSHALQELEVRRADTVLISAGINDLAGVHGGASSPEELIDELESLCSELEQRGMRPVVLGPIWADEKLARTEMRLPIRLEQIQEYRQKLLAWGRRSFRDVVDMHPPLENRPDLLVDGIHPSAQGHRMLWDHLRSACSPDTRADRARRAGGCTTSGLA